MTNSTPGNQQNDSPADDETAAGTGSESPQEGAAAEDAAEDAVVEGDSPAT
ncbi:hypothetical protein ACTU3I_11190 [Microbacterium sp. RD1]|uniref:hypothetical protein n=1 Tax=Microbacterium sp. RD1 TaxID=3457313 RepID=UPI003FA5F30D